MKKIVLLLVILVSSQFFAQALLEESFAYDAGTLITATPTPGWVLSGTNTSNPLTVVSPGLTFPNYPGVKGNALAMTTSGEDDYKAFTPEDSGSVYLFFLVNFSASQTGDYFIALSQSTAQTNYYARLHSKASGAGFVLGISKNNEVSGGALYGSTVLNFNQTYPVCVKYTFNTVDATDDAVSVYVITEASFPTTEPVTPEVGPYTFPGKTDATDLGYITLRQGNATAAPTFTIDEFRIQTTWLKNVLSGNYYIPQGSNPQGFATLNDAVTSLNLIGVTGTVNFLLDADTLRENSFTFNAPLSAANNVVIKPAPGRNVCLIVAPGTSMGNGIQMIGFDKGYVTFDGSNNGSTSRNLIVTTETDAVAVPFGLNTSNADTVVLKNLIIKNLDNVTTNFRYGAVINDKDGVWGLRVENCQIGTATRPVRRDGLAPWGTTAPNQFSFVNNEIYCGTRGVTSLYLTESEIIGNTINLLPTTAGATDSYNHGIYITGASGSIVIKENTINCLEKTINASAYLVGIAFAGNSFDATDSISVVNNIINVGASNETRSTYGIGLRSAGNMGNLKVYFNTIVINDNASTLVSYGIGNHTNGTGPVNIDLKNNIIINNHSGNVGSSAIGMIPATSVLTSDYNDLLSNQNFVNYQGTSYANLAAWQVAAQDAHSLAVNPGFTSATDLHLSSNLSPVVGKGIAIPGITTDIDNELRKATPDIGADENLDVVPVELVAFNAQYSNSVVTLNWKTATETNNQGFQVERKANGDWEKVGYVKGAGTSSNINQYSFVDNNVRQIEKVSYRLKQIDLNGSYNYSSEVEVATKQPNKFELSQNYPNPFNPTTKINYTIPVDSKVTLDVYSITGELVIELVNEVQSAGTYTVDFNASNLANGTYFYKITAGSFVQAKKMMLVK
ncbi:MAG: T9SS type A sorting domain-containing protein [Ignavibacteriales bacterium]|nr:T9SS type A sorting domain-containing protein [Ignavibacteriales bacterium]